MAKGEGLWLIGVRKNNDELAPAGGPRFISQLQQRYRGRENKREGVMSVIRSVPWPADVAQLQREHGKEYVEFYYIKEALPKADLGTAKPY